MDEGAWKKTIQVLWLQLQTLSAYELCLVDSMSPVLRVSSPSSTEFPELNLIFGCGALYMFFFQMLKEAFWVMIGIGADPINTTEYN